MTKPATYRAVVATAPGKLELVERPITEPGHDQVRIQVEACGVCHSDSATVDGFAGVPFPRVPGHEVVGRIEAIGAGVQGWSLGQRVGVVAVPNEPLSVNATDLIFGARSVSGTLTGTVIDNEQTLAFANLQGIHPLVETFPLEQASEAYDRMMRADVRLRAVLVMGAQHHSSGGPDQAHP
ncbi:alcohol dehydrogenase catalytic domain-containing protein [Pseudomonas sp. efr-133-TYG-103a]|uniref:alcohol dehydrogenase catalytic domain-containing protein n=1 Tax=Pseudomonas sp. efr-133-TYG-103a TaxID=3040308 RepID=UPI002553CAB6|nr:alcohol dehydrogenase catalytic domain-containing protein [Pseudomonas sp. efr-133-TYG-103a]